MVSARLYRWHIFTPKNLYNHEESKLCFDCELFYLTSTIRNLNAVFYVIPQCKGMKFITNMTPKNIFFHLLLPVKSVKSPPQTGQGESLCLESLQCKESSFQWWGYYARRWRSMPVDILTTKRKSICLERIQVREHIWDKENSFRLQFLVVQGVQL